MGRKDGKDGEAKAQVLLAEADKCREHRPKMKARVKRGVIAAKAAAASPRVWAALAAIGAASSPISRQNGENDHSAHCSCLSSC